MASESSSRGSRFGGRRNAETSAEEPRGSEDSGDAKVSRFGRFDRDNVEENGDRSERKPRSFGGNENGEGRPRRGSGSPSGAKDENAEPRAPVTYVPPQSLGRDDLKQQHSAAGINFEKYSDVPVEVSGADVTPIKSFATAGLHEMVMEAIQYMGYKTPTPVQKYCIPAILAGQDVMACAQTGSGKTGGYLLPIISKMLQQDVKPAEPIGKSEPQCLVVCPTRELATQVEKEAQIYVSESGLKAFAVYGQVDLRYMANKLRTGMNIISATTGRLKQALTMGLISLEKLQYLVLDEADRMLDMGFAPDVDAILERAPKDRVTLMFSATFPPDIQLLARRFLRDYVFIATGTVGGACEDVKQEIIKTEGRADKKETLERLLRERAEKNNGKMEKTLVFCETKVEADKIGLELAMNSISSTTMHGDRSQEQREQALADFKAGKKAILVATNVAARGLDIPGVEHVINWDLPRSVDDMEDYIHRIGRTGRVGNQGLATTFYDPGRNSTLASRLVEIMSSAGHMPPDWLYEEAGMQPPSDSAREASAPKSGRFAAKDLRSNGETVPVQADVKPQQSKAGDAACRWDNQGDDAVHRRNTAVSGRGDAEDTARAAPVRQEKVAETAPAAPSAGFGRRFK